MSTSLPPLHVQIRGHRLAFDGFVLDTRCGEDSHDHVSEYLAAFQLITGALGQDLISSPPTTTLSPLLRERFKTALAVFRQLGGETTEVERQRIHGLAKTRFVDDYCARIAITKRPQSRVRVAKVSLNRVFELRRFVQTNERFPKEGAEDPVERALAKWLAKQRLNVNPHLAAHLNRHVPAWRFSGREGQWHLVLSLVVWFVAANDKGPSRKVGSEAEKSLGRWVHNQSTALNAKRAGRESDRAMGDVREHILLAQLPTLFGVADA